MSITRKTKKITIAGFAAMALFIGLTAESCDGSNNKPTSQQQGQSQTEQAFSQAASKVPYPADEMKDSLERHQLRDRLLRFNKPNKIGYAYYQSYGKILGYWVVKGKISSVQSQMTTETLVERHGDTGGGNITYSAPGDDLSYGPNEGGDDGIFFFTATGALIETTMDHIIYSDQPIQLAEYRVPKLG